MHTPHLTQIQRAAQHFPEGVRFCFTALGYPSGEGLTEPVLAGLKWIKQNSVLQQSTWLAEAATIALENNVRLMIVWNIDFPCTDSETYDWVSAAYAIIRPGDICPACGMLSYVMMRD